MAVILMDIVHAKTNLHKHIVGSIRQLILVMNELK